jgi:hypothetical protein
MMIDTNTIQQAGDAAQQIVAQVKINWPAISIAGVWLGREIGNFNRWLVNASEFVIRHGGVGSILVKLVWNKGTS